MFFPMVILMKFKNDKFRIPISPDHNAQMYSRESFRTRILQMYASNFAPAHSAFIKLGVQRQWLLVYAQKTII